MGFSYQGGKLCCDICGEAGARKKPCPHEYCQPIACCNRPECKAKLAAHRQTNCHVHCKAASEAFDRREEERQRRLDNGEFLRCAAVGVDGLKDCVKVWFRNKQGVEMVRHMAKATYDAFPLLESVSPEQFEKVGPLFVAPMEFAA